MLGLNQHANNGKGKGIKWLREHVGYQGDDCLVWPFSRRKDGYGQVGVDGFVSKAHNVMCELVHGPAPSRNHMACHECGNGHLGCVHPKHVFWRTHAENMRDMVRHGRACGPHKSNRPTNLTQYSLLPMACQSSARRETAWSRMTRRLSSQEAPDGR